MILSLLKINIINNDITPEMTKPMISNEKNNVEKLITNKNERYLKIYLLFSFLNSKITKTFNIDKKGNISLFKKSK
ncbi:MAG: hypothetical protein QXJ06_05460 [Candidatus Aenigmatarchaeota archaeon]